MRPAAFLALALVVVAANASPQVQTPASTGRPERTVPFRTGETLTYDVSWSTFLVAGTVVTTVKEKKQSFDSTAYYIVAEARPTPLVSSTLLPVLQAGHAARRLHAAVRSAAPSTPKKGNGTRLKTTRFDRKAKQAFFEYQSTTTVKADFPIAASTQDALSAHLRPADDSAQGRRCT